MTDVETAATWDAVLWYRESAWERATVSERLEREGVSADMLATALDALVLHPGGQFSAQTWADAGPIAVALVATEVDALGAHLVKAAAALRSSALRDAASGDLSITDIAARLGVSRQAVSKAASGQRTLLDWANTIADGARRIQEARLTEGGSA